METINVRTGLAPEGSYHLNVRRGRLEKPGYGKVNVQGAETQLLGEAGGGAGMARAGALGGLILGGAGVALGVLAAKKDVVLFESKLADGRVIVAQCTPLAYQEFLIATRSTAPVSLPPTGFWHKPRNTGWVLLIPIMGLGLCGYLSASREPSTPPKAAAAPPAFDFSALQARNDQRRAAARNRARQLAAEIAPFDGTARAARTAAKQVAKIAQGVDCEEADFLADELIAKGHPATIASLNAVIRKGGCEPISRPGISPTPSASKARSSKAADDDLDKLARDSLPDVAKRPASPAPEPVYAPAPTRRAPPPSSNVLDPFGEQRRP
jgi:hypothetical protein